MKQRALVTQSMPWWRAARAPIATAMVALALAHTARHAWVEPADLTARCDAAPWQDVVCVARSVTVQAFINHRLAWAALAMALLATATRWRVAALLAMALGSAGMVLYSAGLAAPAVVLAALVLARPRATAVKLEAAP